MNMSQGTRDLKKEGLKTGVANFSKRINRKLAAERTSENLRMKDVNPMVPVNLISGVGKGEGRKKWKKSEIDTLSYLQKDLNIQIQESKISHNQVGSVPINSMDELWGNVLMCEHRGDRLRFATENTLWNYEYSLEYQSKVLHSTPKNSVDMSMHSLVLNASVNYKGRIEETTKEIKNFKTNGFSKIGNFTHCSLAEKNFFMVTSRGIIQMWPNEGGPVIDINDTYPELDEEISDEQINWKDLACRSFKAVSDNLIFYCDAKNIYKVYLQSKDELFFADYKAQIEDLAELGEYCSHDEAPEDNPNDLKNNPAKTGDKKSQKGSRGAEGEDFSGWRKNLVCSYELMDSDVRISGFDIYQDNMIIYMNNKDLDVFSGVSTMEDGQWKSNPF
jgi:hypothetical protein